MILCKSDVESDAPVYPVVFPSTVQQVLLQFMVEVLAGFHLPDTRVKHINHTEQLNIKNHNYILAFMSYDCKENALAQ